MDRVWKMDNIDNIDNSTRSVVGEGEVLDGTFAGMVAVRGFIGKSSNGRRTRPSARVEFSVPSVEYAEAAVEHFGVGRVKHADTRPAYRVTGRAALPVIARLAPHLMGERSASRHTRPWSGSPRTPNQAPACAGHEGTDYEDDENNQQVGTVPRRSRGWDLRAVSTPGAHDGPGADARGDRKGHGRLHQGGPGRLGRHNARPLRRHERHHAGRVPRGRLQD